MKTSLIILFLSAILFQACKKNAEQLPASANKIHSYKLVERCVKFHVVKMSIKNYTHTTSRMDTICDGSIVDTVRFSRN